MKTQAYPRILLHSDLHLESGPLTLAAVATDRAIAVFAGDVCSGAGGPAALRALTNLPTVYVAGNHEFWGGDYYERLVDIEAQARAHDVHFLERRAVVLDGVRFLGATTWTDYGGGHAALLSYGLWHMKDHQAISAERWWTEANRARFIKQFGEQALEHFDGKFNPLLAMDLHRKTRTWLKRELAKPFAGPTVVVSHHAPCFESLRQAGVRPEALNRDLWARRRSDDLDLTRVGSYASEILPDLHYELARGGVRLWAHGHLHQAMHFGVRGIPVAANPRGRVRQPLTRESADRLALYGMRFTDAELERSQREHEENPEAGDGAGYDKAQSFDLADPGYGLIAEPHAKALADLTQLQEELMALRPFARSRRAAIAELAGHRSDTLWRAVLGAVREFAESMAGQLLPGAGARQLDWLLRDCRLVTDWREFAGLENFGDYACLLTWRRIDAERPEAQRKAVGAHADRYSTEHHLAAVERRTRQLIGAVQRAPMACIELRSGQGRE
jgi:hypothetical protein